MELLCCAGSRSLVDISMRHLVVTAGLCLRSREVRRRTSISQLTYKSSAGMYRPPRGTEKFSFFTSHYSAHRKRFNHVNCSKCPKIVLNIYTILFIYSFVRTCQRASPVHAITIVIVVSVSLCLFITISLSTQFQKAMYLSQNDVAHSSTMVMHFLFLYSCHSLAVLLQTWSKVKQWLPMHIQKKTQHLGWLCVCVCVCVWVLSYFDFLWGSIGPQQRGHFHKVRIFCAVSTSLNGCLGVRTYFNGWGEGYVWMRI